MIRGHAAPWTLLLVLSTGVHSWQDRSQDPYQMNMTHYSRDCTVVDGIVTACAPRPAGADAKRVACVGDSITAVGHTSSVAHHYPDQLQDLLDEQWGNGTYSVTNLGICGSTLQHQGADPWTTTPAYTALVENTWDIVIVMLGTNDAAPDAQGYWPQSNHENCDAADPAKMDKCNFAVDYAALLDVVKTLGRDADYAPEIHIMVPPPLMLNGAYNMNETIINTVLPRLMPLISEANAGVVTSLIDVFSGFGGVADWESEFPTPGGCELDSSWAPCAWYCDEQSCDQCHPNDVGCAYLAQVVYDGLFPGV